MWRTLTCVAGFSFAAPLHGEDLQANLSKLGIMDLQGKEARLPFSHQCRQRTLELQLAWLLCPYSCPLPL